MALNASTVTVGTSATLVSAANGRRNSVTVYNGDSAAIYVGDASVTDTVGIPVAASSSESFTGTDALYAISTAGTAADAVRVLEFARWND